MPALHVPFVGLSYAEVQRRLNRFGRNEFSKQKRYSLGKLLLSQFSSPLIYILLIAALITFSLGDHVDALVIMMAVVVNTSLGFWQEFKAEKSLERLSAVLCPEVVVIRDGERQEVAVDTLVPGDVVLLEAGDRVPADSILVDGQGLGVDEAVLTGESMSVTKSFDKTPDKPAEIGIEEIRRVFVGVEDRDKNGRESVYAGTTVIRGSGVVLVAYTGAATEVGKIADQLKETREEETPLQKRLAQLSSRIAIIIGLVAILIFVIGLIGQDSILEIFSLSVAVAVSAIPEGLVVSLTAILAVGMQRILKRKALVRKLVAAEVLGSVSVICSDKTGTLTEGSLKVVDAVIVDERLAYAAAVSTSDMKDPLEVALWEWVKEKLGVSGVEKLQEDYLRIDRLPFSSEQKLSATLTHKELFVTGAPEILLAQCRMSPTEKAKWEEQFLLWAQRGYRLVALGHRKRQPEEKLTKATLSRPWYFLGFVVLEDQVRRGVKKALEDASRAGITVKVITGDYRETAMEVMRQLGIAVANDEMMDGQELEAASSHELDHRIGTIKLFYRTSPSQKFKIVESLQRLGEVVAMTGDGVNDAPALKKANVGVVVSTASDVSKETADVVLLNNDFGTIVAAVEEGRNIFVNLRKVILFLLSDSFSEVVLVLGSLLLMLPMPITAAQILWVNLVNDGLPSLALTIEPKPGDLLNRKPRDPQEPIIDKRIGLSIGVISLVSGSVALALFTWYWLQTGNIMLARTMAFCLLSVDSLLYIFSSRSLRINVWRDRPFRNPWLVGAVVVGLLLQIAAVYVPFLQVLLRTVPIGMVDWLWIVLGSFASLIALEILKMVFIAKGHGSDPEAYLSSS